MENCGSYRSYQPSVAHRDGALRERRVAPNVDLLPGGNNALGLDLCDGDTIIGYTGDVRTPRTHHDRTQH